MASSPSADGIAASASLSALAQLSVGLTVCPVDFVHLIDAALQDADTRGELQGEPPSPNVSPENRKPGKVARAETIDNEREPAEESLGRRIRHAIYDKVRQLPPGGLRKQQRQDPSFSSDWSP